ncbi:Membrane protein involved in the export of O-antigen and teichoic acid [Treponema bryantii]|uniref:Membrane protein involved in the export of O-antigen and teichoic acid n=1 Tax=Treponema bryantii TaxID=163 RepID=A0A1H9J4A0_9SPIR|nr:flippase [Treponema bryantii]SEQ81569.1 Membrane protein involved in the export of O-antigen and teichoic acid [Treponema bryantii]
MLFKNKNNLKLNATINSIRAILGLIFPLITFPYSSRILGPVSLGKVNFSQSIVNYFAIIAALGISTYGIREAAKIKDNKIKLTQLFKEIFTINIISTISAYLLLFISIFLIPKFHEYRNLIIIFSCSLLFTTIGVEWLYTALEEFIYIALRSFIFQILSMILLFSFVKSSDDILIYAGIAVFSSVGSNICNFVHLRKYIIINQKIKLEIKKHIKPIFILFSMTVAISIYTLLDTSMLGFLSNDEQVGFYSAATKINKLVVSVIASALTVLLPRLSYYISKKDNDSFTSLLSKSFNVTILLALPCTIGLSLVAKPTILLFCGLKYSDAIPVMKIMNPIILAISISNLIGVQMFMPLGKEKITLYSVLIGAVSNFILNYILIPIYGALGAAIATLTAESSVTIFQFIFARKYFIWNKILPNIFQSIIATIFMSIVVFFVSETLQNSISSLFISIIIGIIIYGTVLILFRNTLLMDLLQKRKKNEI